MNCEYGKGGRDGVGVVVGFLEGYGVHLVGPLSAQSEVAAEVLHLQQLPTYAIK